MVIIGLTSVSTLCVILAYSGWIPPQPAVTTLALEFGEPGSRYQYGASNDIKLRASTFSWTHGIVKGFDVFLTSGENGKVPWRLRCGSRFKPDSDRTTLRTSGIVPPMNTEGLLDVITLFVHLYTAADGASPHTVKLIDITNTNVKNPDGQSDANGWSLTQPGGHSNAIDTGFRGVGEMAKHSILHTENFFFYLGLWTPVLPYLFIFYRKGNRQVKQVCDNYTTKAEVVKKYQVKQVISGSAIALSGGDFKPLYVQS